ncbi:MAG: DUF4332 domain-containing protein [Gammaproteobacteria bacterium]|jgi:predicted flap endonuclease-1-like 5' DNA nuclease|nr:DUF4332 domain-containing protein [Gammaproteobacteria bacterium]
MSYSIQKIEGIGPAYGSKLRKAGIRTTRDFLKHCCDAKGRKQAAKGTGFSTKQLLEWANLADLMRITGIGPQYSELLEAAGVDTVKELCKRNAENVAAKMKQVNARKRVTRTVPSASMVQQWIVKAKRMKPLITH